MRSSSSRSRALRVLGSSLMLAACSTAPLSDSPGCEAASGEAAAWRAAVTQGPLYAVALRGAPVAACSLRQEAQAIELEFRFADGSRLQARRDGAIELSEQSLRWAGARGGFDARALLRRAEQAAFSGGCGIDWAQPETAPAAGEPGAVDSVYRGETCNCQARVRHDASGRVLMLALRSAC
ncbi:hypothetical protein [Azohydromonas caseinilytica]|uniref:Lipoprotein n=1 Tax=Azohydromonas caseinilytica TaxID=2728836 RepID=A0A848FDT3_9BURK|nr:hypothetical protein [Azohydromonas caseinilytica]NML16539.1 hypothetical protein [Azohydromonas caseinilytica]